MEFVKINGQSYPYRLSWKAIKKINLLTDAGEIKNIESPEYALYWALYTAHYKETPQEEFNFKQDQMADILDDDLDLVVKVLNDIQAVSNKMSGGNEQGKLQVSKPETFGIN